MTNCIIQAILVLSLGLDVLSLGAQAATGSNGFPCERQAARAVRAEFSEYFGEAESPNHRLIESIDCKVVHAGKRTLQTCNVTASNGEGSGYVWMGVVLNYRCTRVIQTYLRFEPEARSQTRKD